MQVVILCGGIGTRLREETEYRPKPMVEIGGRPILWHIMKLYAHYGHKDFILCLGYKGHIIRDYFYHYEIRNNDFTVTLGSRDIQIHDGGHGEVGWRVVLTETGEDTLTGGRIKRIARYLEGRFLATYGDGVADVDIPTLIEFHERQGKLGTVTGVHPGSRFGELAIKGDIVDVFREKPQIHEGWINGGFFVFEPEVIDLIGGDDDSLEQGLLARLAQRRELAVYQHSGFWQCMDTYRETRLLDEMWRNGSAPWRVWGGDGGASAGVR